MKRSENVGVLRIFNTFRQNELEALKQLVEALPGD